MQPQLLTLAKFKNLDNFAKETNQLIIDEEFDAVSPTARPNHRLQKFWFLTLEARQNPATLKSVESRIYNELQKFQELDSINPHISIDYRDHFSKRIKCNEFILRADKKQQLEDFLVDFLDFFC